MNTIQYFLLRILFYASIHTHFPERTYRVNQGLSVFIKVKVFDSNQIIFVSIDLYVGSEDT